jgi:serine phosphatase RsbU (regulator of sigma subunit)/anti-sigma regulatory factor (Ser/Thr protein kinase)
MAAPRRLEVASDADVAAVRRAVRAEMPDVSSGTKADAELVASELVTNALLHGGGVAALFIAGLPNGLRIEVTDRNRHAPLEALPSNEAMTGRGFGLVRQLASRWGVEPMEDGKTVWAEITDDERPTARLTAEEVLASWEDPWDADAPERVRVSLGEVPTGLLVAAKRHVDNVVREFRLATGGDWSGTTDPMPEPLAELVERVVHDFEDARLEIKRQATTAAQVGARHTMLELHLPTSAAGAAERYLRALDDADAYSRANRLLTLETPPQHRVFRHWYITEIVRQLRAAEAGERRPEPMSFEDRLLAEVDAAEDARQSADRAARLYGIATALAAATTAEEVAAAVLDTGVAALGASGGGVLLSTTEDRLLVPGTLGYDEAVVERLRDESPDAELPAAYALRTGEPVWLETVEERNSRFPALQGLEPGTVAMCAVPVVVAGQRLGALRFSFPDQRLFDDDEQRFVFALAAEAAQALDRAKLLERERDARLHAERQQTSLEKLATVGEAMLRGRGLEDILDFATAAATQIAGAEFGAFFYNDVDETGESFLLYALSGVPRSAFAGFPMPRNTEIFGPTFRGESIVRLDDVTEDPRFGRNPPFDGLPRGHLPVRSYLAVPVSLSDGEVVGGLFFGHGEAGQFDVDDERLVAGVAGQAAAAIENVKSIEDRQRIATVLQQSLLPAALPEHDRLELAAVYRSAEAVVGGDFYDVFRLDRDRWGVAIGDVRGRGPRAATVTAMARYTIRASAHLGRSPGDVCALLNEIVLDGDDPEEFLSVVYAEIDLGNDIAVCRYANAGHPPPIVLRDSGAEVLSPTGPLVGVTTGAQFEERTAEMLPGDVLVLYTDGVTEARREGEEFGLERMLELLPRQRDDSARAIADGVTAAVSAFAGPLKMDDAAVFVLKVH